MPPAMEALTTRIDSRSGGGRRTPNRRRLGGVARWFGALVFALSAAPHLVAYETACDDGVDNDGDIYFDRGTCSVTVTQACSIDANCPGGETCDISLADNDCISEQECQNDVDDDLDGFEDRGRCMGAPATLCTGDLDCPLGDTCDLSMMDVDCQCLDANIDFTGGCTANDVRLVFVGLGSILDACWGGDDPVNVFAFGVKATTGATNRYDIGLTIALDGGDARKQAGAAAKGGHCSRQILTPPIYSCSVTAQACGFDYPDCPMGESCETTNPFRLTPSAADVQSGDGPFRNLDLVGSTEAGDKCADLSEADGEVLFNYPFEVSLPCSPAVDGLVQISYCSSWDQNSNSLCDNTAQSAPGTSAKCRCEAIISDIPAPDLNLGCVCPATFTAPGETTTCSIALTNDVSCTPDPSAPEELRCGTFGFGRVEMDYDQANVSISGTPTTSGPGSAGPQGTGGTTSDDADTLTWDFVSRNDTPNIVGPIEPGPLSPDSTATFTFLVDASAPDGQITNPVTLVYSSDAAFTTPVAQTLTASCDINVAPTYAPVGGVRAIADSGRVVVEWSTAVEHATTGFEVYRRRDDGEFVRVHEGLVPATQHLPGGTYRLLDQTASIGDRLVYRLVEVEESGARRSHGPFEVEIETVWGPRKPMRVVEAPLESLPMAPERRQLDRLAASRAERARTRRRARAAVARPLPRRTAELVLGVSQRGLYYLPGPEIGAGRQRMRLTNRGEEVATLRLPGVRGLLFFGEAIDDAYTAENVYRLSAGRGLEMSRIGGPGPRPASWLQAFVDTVHFEEEHEARTYLASSPHDDYWHWLVVAAGHPELGEASVELDLADVAGWGEATLQLDLFGGVGVNEVEIWLNGVQIGQPRWQGSGPHREYLGVAPALLDDGPNVLRIKALENFTLLDSVDVTYERLYRAVDDFLILRGDRHPVVTVRGFSKPPIMVLDITEPKRPVLLRNTTVDRSRGGFRVSFRPQSPTHEYLVVSAKGLGRVDSLRAAFGPTILDRSNRADYLVIAPAALAPAAGKLAALRALDGYETRVVEVEEIMDAANHGISSPEAIKEFLAYAFRQWSLPPSIVVLAGAGSIDFRDGLGLGGNLIPPLMVRTASDLVASDMSLGDVDDDGVPEMAVSRIPVLTQAELASFIAKIAAYESALAGGWTDTVLMVADDADEYGDFPADSDALIAGFPSGVTAERAYLETPLSLAETRQAFVDLVNAGAGYVNLIGHGGISQFAGEGVVRKEEVQQLFNGSRLPVVTALTCYVGYFAFPGYQSLGEEMLLRAEGGAAAVWGPAGLSFNRIANQLGTHNFAAFFDPSKETIGQALLAAYQDFADSGGDVDQLTVFNLLGDAATKLP